MKLLGFLIRILLLVALVIWLADRPGSAQVEWRGYVMETSAAVLAVLVAAIVYAFVLLHRVWRFLVDGPRFWRLRRKTERLEDGHAELSRGLAAIAAGDPAEAGKRAVKARRMLGETPVTRLLQAQAAQMAGDERSAKALFEAMTQDPETAILGYRGLIMAALRAGDLDEATRQMQRVEQAQKNVPWLHLVKFDLASRSGNWIAAEAALGKARKSRVLKGPVADRAEAAVLLAHAKSALREDNPRLALDLAEKARRSAPDWVPAALILAEAQIKTDHSRAALRTVEKAWRKAPHPQLMPLALWAQGATKSIEAYKLVDRITRDNKSAFASQMALADAALKADLWGEARRYLVGIVNRGEATQLTYQMLARLDRRENANEKAAAGWLARAVTAPPDAQWLCTTCGAAHEYWEASCNLCGAFNRMEWAVPGKSRASSSAVSGALLGYDEP